MPISPIPEQGQLVEVRRRQYVVTEVAPGVYSETIVMKPHVDLQGSGQGVTKITAQGSAVISSGSTIVGADNAEIRLRTIENTGGPMFAIAVRNDSASPHLTDVTLSVSGSPYAYGVINDEAAPLLTNVTLTASGNYAYGVSNHRSVPVIRGSAIQVAGASNAFGVYSYIDLDGVPFTVTLNNSRIASTGGTIYGQLKYTAFVANSQLSGGGAMICAGVYDENYLFYASTCP